MAQHQNTKGFQMTVVFHAAHRRYIIAHADGRVSLKARNQPRKTYSAEEAKKAWFSLGELRAMAWDAGYRSEWSTNKTIW